MLAAGATRAAAQCELRVDPAGETYRTIQSAIDALPRVGPCHITVHAGTYHETLNLTGLNAAAQADSERVVIAGERGATLVAAGEHAIVVSNSRFITIEGLTISGARHDAIVLDGTGLGNQDITIARLDVHHNGIDAAGNGLVVTPGNARSWIVNNLLRDNGQNGVEVTGGVQTDGSVYVTNNTILGNAWNGVALARGQPAFLANNLIVGNGLATGTSGGRWGVLCRRGSGPGTPELITLLHNVLFGNGRGAARGIGGDIGDSTQILDPSDVGNRTTHGSEGTGVNGCAIHECAGGSAMTFFEPGDSGRTLHLRADSPALGSGLSSLVRDGREWVPSEDFDGHDRPANGSIDAGADQRVVR